MSILHENLNKPAASFAAGMETGGGAGTGASAGLKLAVFASFLLALISLAGSAFLYQSLNSERRERQALEGAQDQIREKSVSLEKVSEDYKSQMEEMEAKLKNYEDGQEQLRQFKKAVEENRNQIISLQSKLKEAEEIKQKALEMQNPAEEEFEPAVPAPAPVSASKPAVPAAKSSAPAAAKPSASTKTAAPEPARSPQVLTVNRKFNFVVVSLGMKDGIQMGDSIEIIRQGKSVANVQVEKLYENFSAAAIVRESKDAPVKEGDLIRKAS